MTKAESQPEPVTDMEMLVRTVTAELAADGQFVQDIFEGVIHNDDYSDTRLELLNPDDASHTLQYLVAHLDPSFFEGTERPHPKPGDTFALFTHSSAEQDATMSTSLRFLNRQT